MQTLQNGNRVTTFWLTPAPIIVCDGINRLAPHKIDCISHHIKSAPDEDLKIQGVFS